MKDRLIKELQEKIDLRERQIAKLEKEVKELEANLVMTNEKRFKLQETIGSMEKELQSTKAHVNQLADINTRYDVGMRNSNNISVEGGDRKTAREILRQDLDRIIEYNHPSISRRVSKQGSSFNVRKSFKCKKSSSSVISCNNLVDISENIVLHQNAQTSVEPIVEENECREHLNSRSLIGLTLQKVDLLRTRLNYLTAVNVEPFLDNNLVPVRVGDDGDRVLKSCSTQTVRDLSNQQKHFAKILELTANRYELLQKQAYESYAELTKLMKLAASSHDIFEK